MPANRRTARPPASAFLVILLLILIVGCLIVASNSLITNVAISEVSTSDVDLVLRISGDDIVVAVLGGERSTQLSSLDVYIYGHEHIRQHIQPTNGSGVMYCKNIAKNIEGWQTVIVDGTFSNGEQKTIGYIRLNFG
ncbi:hypothetical protein [Methanocorpusculum vombati]|uniref:Archaeal Type IV pilin N-terminal domain-containing protein n=1 Tax=Methanocorpusculum vombati TaxID=3002864 RepID=A0ABT4IMZ8_9EURY|nr:hypothetical protein [Methanocorpusculum vombati]MCZ9318983.1 hypothetical protein [Methanocorpusculum sp.]MCZ0863121.1 hypothetical protein [Methanocorpusculum vombati]MDE2521525.1 hypothetical protein [Methanocorpusculum sp.]MDE2545211.1 hypothetical protein [Methanocorpusculum sp.]MDE2548210.1 hypothetical protein [Methanocorpusculum sp.]